VRTREQQRLPHTARPLADVVALVLEELPEKKRGDIHAICQAVKEIATASEWLKWGEQNLVQGVRAALRAKCDSGMPRAVNINGSYRDPKQLEFVDFVAWAYTMAQRGQQMFGKARAVAGWCEEFTGRAFDVDEVIRAARQGEAVEQLVERLSA